MTEERQSSSGMSMLHSMLKRLKSPETPQSSSHDTEPHCRHSNDANQSDSVFIKESDKPEWNFAGSIPLECSVKPKGHNDADADSEYFVPRTDPQEASPTSTTFPKSEQSSYWQNNLLRNTRQDLQPSQSNPTRKEMKEEQTSQVESHFSILKSRPTNGSFTHNPQRSSVSNPEPRFGKGMTEYEIMNQHPRSENTVSH